MENIEKTLPLYIFTLPENTLKHPIYRFVIPFNEFKVLF